MPRFPVMIPVPFPLPQQQAQSSPIPGSTRSYRKKRREEELACQASKRYKERTHFRNVPNAEKIERGRTNKMGQHLFCDGGGGGRRRREEEERICLSELCRVRA